MLLSFSMLAVTVVALLSTRRRSPATQIVVEALLLAAIAGVLSRHGVAPLPAESGFPPDGLGTWLRALATIWWLIGARLVVTVTLLARGRDPRSRDARLFSDLLAAIVHITAVLIVLNSVLNLPVNGLLATSGVVAIVLGLALQNTLADVFSGIAVGVERPFQVGDRVSLGTIEGVIVQINWRSVRIHTDGDDLATIPNSVVAKSQVINRSAPTFRRSTSVEVSVWPDAHPDNVIELMRQATLLCPTILPTPPPVLALKDTSPMSATYAATFFVAESQFLAQTRGTFLRQVRRIFRTAGIGRSGPMTDAELLGSLVLFESLGGEDVAALAARLAAHDLGPGDVVFRQDGSGTSIYVVASGVLEITRRSANGSQSMGRIGPGEYIGELGLITGAPRGGTMTALTHARVLELPGDSLVHLLRSDARLNAAMERSVRKGLALLERDTAARTSEADETAPDLLARIKAFFKA